MSRSKLAPFDVAIEELHKRGFGAREIAELLPVSASVSGVHTRLRAMGYFKISQVERLTPKQREEIKEGYRAGESGSSLARRYGMYTTDLLAWLRAEGVPVRGQAESRTLFGARARQAETTRAVARMGGWEAAAQELGVSPERLLCVLDEHGLLLRDTDEME